MGKHLSIGHFSFNLKGKAADNALRLLLICAIISVFMVIAFTKITAIAGEESKSVLFKYYTAVEVMPGDTLWDIADKYYQYQQYEDYKDIREYINDIKRLNNMSDDTIYSGEQIIVTYYSPEYK